MAAEREGQEGFFDRAGAVIASVYNAVTRDGAIDAFLRQGANEIGAATKAFPDSIQIDEPGAVFNPLYSDIAADRRERGNSPAIGEASLPSPADIAGGKSSGSVYGDSQAVVRADLPSPGQIASNTPPSAEPDHAQELSHSHGRGM